MKNSRIFMTVCTAAIVLSGCLTDDIKDKPPAPEPIAPEVVEPKALVPGWYQGNVRPDFTAGTYADVPDKYYSLLLDQGDGKVQVWSALIKSKADPTQAIGFGVQKYLAEYNELDKQLSSDTIQTLTSRVVASSVSEMRADTNLGRYYDTDVEWYGTRLNLTNSGQAGDDGYTGSMIVDKESVLTKSLSLTDASLVMPEEDFARPASLSILTGRWDLTDHTLRARFTDEPTENFYNAYLDISSDGSFTITYRSWFGIESFILTDPPGQVCTLSGTVTASDTNNYFTFNATTPLVVSHEPSEPMEAFSPGNPCELGYGRGTIRRFNHICQVEDPNCATGQVSTYIDRPDWDARVTYNGVMIVAQPEQLFIIAHGTQDRGEEIHDNSGRIFTGVWKE